MYCNYIYEGGGKCYTETNLDAAGKCVSHCCIGLAQTQAFRRLAEEGRLSIDQMYAIMRKDDEHYVLEHGCEPMKKTHQGNGTYQGAFAFTLTKSPDDQLTEFDMIKAVRKIMSQQSCPVKKYAWYLEYGDDELKTHPHIHGMYETQSQGMIETKHWKRAWPIWDPKVKLGKGFRGGYHRPVRSEEGYTDYIKKDAGKNESFGLE